MNDNVFKPEHFYAEEEVDRYKFLKGKPPVGIFASLMYFVQFFEG